MAGFSALVDLATRARLSNGKVILAKPSKFVAGIFETTRLNTWFDMSASVEEATQQLS